MGLNVDIQGNANETNLIVKSKDAIIEIKNNVASADVIDVVDLFTPLKI